MLIYLLKSTACLLIFSIFYKLLLERENLHHFKRFYLIGSLVLSFSIPLITFTTYVQPELMETDLQPLNFVKEQPMSQGQTIEWIPLILLILYGLGATFYAIKFIRNLFVLVKKIKANEKIDARDHVNVLLLKSVVPHTFLKYIFLEKRAFVNGEIPEEILCHERTHAQEKHSLDILFVEIIQVVFWFNPLIAIYKKDMKLNHEFLADRAVLNSGIDTKFYQNILLQYSKKQSVLQLESSFNYSSIKKRFTVMKRKTSKQKIRITAMLLLPLFALMLYSFSETKEVVEQGNTKLSNNEIIQNILISIDMDNKLSLNQKPVQLGNLRDEVNNLNRHLTNEQKQIFLSASIHYENEASKPLISQIQKVLLSCYVYQTSYLNIKTSKNLGKPSALPNNKYTGKTLEEANAIYETQTIDLSRQKTNDKNSPWQIEVGVNDDTYTENKDSNIPVATENMVMEYNEIVNGINSKPIEDKVYKLKDINRMLLIYSQMTEEQKSKSKQLPDIHDEDFYQQQKATKEQIEEYNKLAKHYNNMPKDNLVISKGELERMKYLYSIMTVTQRKKAEPLPDIKLPPPPPPAPAPNKNLKEVVVTGYPSPKDEKKEVKEVIVTGYPSPKVVEIVEVPNPPNQEIEEPVEVIIQEIPAPKINEVEVDAPSPPPPPPPIPPLDFVIKMAKKDGAEFYYNGKRITSDKAIQLMKKNKDMNVVSHGSKTENPKIHLTDQPIVNEN